MHAICHVFVLESPPVYTFLFCATERPENKKASIKFTSILTHVISIENHS